MSKPFISAVIPCLDEEETLPACIEKVQTTFDKLGIFGEVVVGDNGSTDNSVEIAKKLGARVVHQKIRGYGAALQAAISATEGEYIIMADADDSYDWSDIEPFIKKLEQGYDFVIGNRFKGKILPKAMPFLHRYIGNPILSAISRLLYNVKVGDFHCGMRAFTRQAFDKMFLKTNGMEFATEMIVCAARINLKIAEVPINLYPDKRNRPPHLRTFRDGWRHLRFIISYAPNYLYLAPGGAMFLLGLSLMILLGNGPIVIAGAYMGIHYLALGLLLTLVGMNIVSMGLIAKLYLLRQSKGLKNRVANWFKNYFSLERGLILGVAISAIGFVIDVIILFRRITIGGQMNNSIHIAFVGTGLLAIGVNILFTAFLIGIILTDYPDQNNVQ